MHEFTLLTGRHIQEQQSTVNAVLGRSHQCLHSATCGLKSLQIPSESLCIECGRFIYRTKLKDVVLFKQFIIEKSKFHQRVGGRIRIDYRLTCTIVIDKCNSPNHRIEDWKSLNGNGNADIKYSASRRIGKGRGIRSCKCPLKSSQLVSKCHTNPPYSVSIATLFVSSCFLKLSKWHSNCNCDRYQRSNGLQISRSIVISPINNTKGISCYKGKNTQHQKANKSFHKFPKKNWQHSNTMPFGSFS